METKKDNRKSIALKLHPVHDTDLIEWVDQLEKSAGWKIGGTGIQGAIKAILRAALG